MTVIFLTNILTPHQLPLSQTFFNTPAINFELIECADIDRSTTPIGWRQTGDFDFVVSYKDLMSNMDYYIARIADADVVIIGSAPNFLIKKRLKKNKLTFKYSERVYKKECPWYEIPLRAVKYYFQFARYKSLYLLCASAYTAGDYAKTGTFLNKTFKWGYFPKTYEYDIEKLIKEKDKNSILWAGRFLDWKHPECIIEAAKRLKENGYKFIFRVIGTGELEEQIKASISKNGLEDYVKLLGSMSPEEVRAYMEKSEIFLFTSDRQEGWGAVLNESMNSGCAVVASHAIGSVPFLIEDTKNGFIYEDGNMVDLIEKVKYLIDNPEKRQCLVKEAYKTITDVWNSKTAVQRLLQLINSINDSSNNEIFESGVCSKSPYLSDDWYKVR